MTKLICAFFLSTLAVGLVACGPGTGTYTSAYSPPVYSVYRPPLVVDYGNYHDHGGHHHHHDGEQRDHYHPKNQWDKIAYNTANKNLSSQDIQNINQLETNSKKDSSRKKQ